MNAYTALAPLYDALTADVPYGAFADFYENIFRKYNLRPELILDLACGTGTLTAELARRGYELIGVDSSSEMLSLAKEKLCSMSLQVMPFLLCQRLQELDLYGTVSAAVCSLDGFDYLTGLELEDTLCRLRLFIEPGGLLIFDVNTPEKLRSLDGGVFLDEREDLYCVWRASFDEQQNALTYGMDIFTRDHNTLWRRMWEEHVEYAHTRPFLEERLTANGFTDIQVYGELADRPPAEGEQRIFFAARRE